MLLLLLLAEHCGALTFIGGDAQELLLYFLPLSQANNAAAVLSVVFPFHSPTTTTSAPLPTTTLHNQLRTESFPSTHETATATPWLATIEHRASSCDGGRGRGARVLPPPQARRSTTTTTRMCCYTYVHVLQTHSTRVISNRRVMTTCPGSQMTAIFFKKAFSQPLMLPLPFFVSAWAIATAAADVLATLLQ